MRLALISVTLFGYWLVLSGHYDTWLVVSGGVLSVAVVAFCMFKGITDEEGFPIEKLPRALAYWPWLGWQMVLSAWNVTKLILDPKLPISPTMVKVDVLQKSAVGIATYANSITLTPGTVTIQIDDGELLVHALAEEVGNDLAGGEMDRRVTWLEGRGP